LALPFIHLHHQVKGLRATIFAIVMGLFFAKLVAALFLFVDDARRGVTWLVKRFTSNRAPGELLDEGEKISRSVFLSWMGMIMGGGIFGSLIYGFTNKYRYQVKKIKLSFANVPNAFKGLKIVQLSDIHSGSFTD